MADANTDERPITVHDLKTILPDIVKQHVCTQRTAVELHTTLFGELRQALSQTSNQLMQMTQFQTSMEKVLTERMTTEFGNLGKDIAMSKQAAELRHQALTDLLKTLSTRVEDIELSSEAQQLKIQGLEQRLAHIEDESSRDIENLQLALRKLEAIMSPETIQFITKIKGEYETNKNRWVTVIAIASGLIMLGTGVAYFQTIMKGAHEMLEYFKSETKKSISDTKIPEEEKTKEEEDPKKVKKALPVIPPRT